MSDSKYSALDDAPSDVPSPAFGKPRTLIERPKRDPRVIEAMREAMRAGKTGAVILVSNIEDIAPREVREAFEKLIDTAAAVEREACADTALHVPAPLEAPETWAGNCDGSRDHPDDLYTAAFSQGVARAYAAIRGETPGVVRKSIALDVRVLDAPEARALLADKLRLDWLDVAGRRDDSAELLADVWVGDVTLRDAIDRVMRAEDALGVDARSTPAAAAAPGAADANQVHGDTA